MANINWNDEEGFFRIFIKLISLYWIVSTLFSAIPSNISFALSDFGYEGYLWVTGAVFVIIGIFWLLIKRTDFVIDLLKLEKGFDDDRIQFEKFNNANIVKLASLIIGAMLVVENIPGFLSHTLFALQDDISGVNRGRQDNFFWAISAINIILGFFLLTNYKWVCKFLTKEE